VPQGSLQVFIIILYENVFQNAELFPTQDSLSPEQSTLTKKGLFYKVNACQRLEAGHKNHIFRPQMINQYDFDCYTV
jgi:hypothetical protein